MKTLEEMKKIFKEGKTHLLTVDRVKKLKGKKIATIYFGYSGQDGVDNFVVGDIVNELEYVRNLKEECFPNKHGHKNRAEYWESYMTPQQLKEKKEKLLLLTEDGRNTFIFTNGWLEDGEFCCSDMDRFVYYIEDED